jgi:sec-independent protein translocase protein TatB
MTGIAGTELLLLMLIGLVILGPQRLPRIASQVGSWIGQARRMTRAMKRQLEDELRTEEFTQSPFDSHVPNDDDTYSPAHDTTPAAPATPPSPVQANARASDVALPEDDDDDTMPPPGTRVTAGSDTPDESP